MTLDVRPRRSEQALRVRRAGRDRWTRDHWPDCADQTPYDFRAEARRLAG
jgi:hypothetical protein